MVRVRDRGRVDAGPLELGVCSARARSVTDVGGKRRAAEDSGRQRAPWARAACGWPDIGRARGQGRTGAGVDRLKAIYGRLGGQACLSFDILPMRANLPPMGATIDRGTLNRTRPQTPQANARSSS